MITLNGSRADLMGLSGDTKPETGIEINTLFLELDTGCFYYFTGETWAEVGGSTSDTTEGD
jgi:hypothetical protein